MDRTAEATICAVTEEQTSVVQQIDLTRHAAITAWKNYANENMRPMKSISERNGGSGEYKKISLRVTIRLPSAT